MEQSHNATIVVGTDFSPASLLALPWASAFAKGLGARLSVVHVARRDERASADATAEFGAAMEILDLQPRVRSVLGEPAEALSRAAAAEDAELIVTAHRSAHDGIFGRSMSLALVRRAEVPVLAVHVAEAVEAMRVAPRELRELVLGVGPDGLAQEAATRLARFCARIGARLVLVEVLVDRGHALDPETGYLELEPGPAHVVETGQARARLERIANALPHAEVETVVVVADSAAKGLIGLGIQRGSDVLCTVARGRGRLAAALLGSATDDALRLSPLPVLMYGPESLRGA
ncbi:MAG: universal stress protein [Deltaproteobacteria bacterium]|nr:universal stress protein [Deltaproteobacteria bacterium]